MDVIEHAAGNIVVNPQSLEFELPDLYKICGQLDSDIASIDYLSFRKMLYRYPTNQLLQSHQGVFELLDNRGHVDQSRYCLKSTINAEFSQEIGHLWY